MIPLEFTEEEIEAWHYRRFHPPHPRVQERCEVAYLKALGVLHQEIERMARRSQPTVRHDLEMYQEGRLERLLGLDFNQPTRDLEAHRSRLEEAFRTNPARTINEACERMEQLTGVWRSPTPVRAFLKRMGLKGRKVGPIPAQADPGAGHVSGRATPTPVGRSPGRAAPRVFRGCGAFRPSGLPGLPVVLQPGLHSLAFIGLGDSTLPRVARVRARTLSPRCYRLFVETLFIKQIVERP